ncbi:MAG: lipid-A-disaccharide synthase [Nitrospiraceae bacterium]|nr:lipid-A-disaccharide synthase [Nitrospiraceae bacterium]
MTRIFFSAGESSGDIHGANLIRALRAADPAIICEGLGGRHMAEAGMLLHHDLAAKAIMGFSEVIQSLRPIRQLFLETIACLEETRPDCLVVIDYPGFNIRLAKKAKALGIPVVYYISPQVWAWKKDRIHTIADAIQKMLVILPFEEKLYHDIGVPCAYVGHPLFDHIASFQPTGEFEGSHVIGLLPGSRKQEIERLMPIMVEVARSIHKAYPDARFVTPCVDERRGRQVRAALEGFPVETVIGKAYEVLHAARFCLVASGTATLETALFGVPMAILYKTTAFNYVIARWLVRIKQIGLANILAGRPIVPEFIQQEACVERVLPAALELIGDTPRRDEMLRDLNEVRERLGGPGASARAAAEVLDVIRETSS